MDIVSLGCIDLRGHLRDVSVPSDPHERVQKAYPELVFEITPSFTISPVGRTTVMPLRNPSSYPS